MPTTTIDLLRHGMPEGGRRYRGHGVDDPLSARGWEQMFETADRVAGWDYILTSPMQRCAAFARRLAEQRDLPVETVEGLKEVGFGAWEGRSPAELDAESPGIVERFHADPVGLRPAGAEDLDAFAGRIHTTLDGIIERHAGRHVLLVVHAGVIRAVLGYAMNAPTADWYRARVDNGALTRCRHNAHGLGLVMHNWRPTPS